MCVLLPSLGVPSWQRSSPWQYPGSQCAGEPGVHGQALGPGGSTHQEEPTQGQP